MKVHAVRRKPLEKEEQAVCGYGVVVVVVVVV